MHHAFGETHLLDEPDVERSLELGVAEDAGGQYGRRGHRERDEPVERRRIERDGAVTGDCAPVVSDEDRSASGRDVFSMSP